MIKVLCLSLFVLSGCSVFESKNEAVVTEQSAEENLDHAYAITEKYWKLVKLAGQDVVMSEHQEREAHFILKTAENRLSGFSGCNNFFGSYTLEKGNRIHFSQLGATKRACPNLQVSEHEFLQVFGMADNYSLNGDTLELYVGRRAPLAIFEAVYFQ